MMHHAHGFSFNEGIVILGFHVKFIVELKAVASVHFTGSPPTLLPSFLPPHFLSPTNIRLRTCSLVNLLPENYPEGEKNEPDGKGGEGAL